MMIREAKIEDLSYMINAAPKFFEHAGFFKKGITYDEESFKENLEKIISFENAITLIFENNGIQCGAISLIISESFLNKKQKIAQELFWWVDEDKRHLGIGSALVSKAIKYCKNKNVDILIMITSDSKHENKLISMYIDNGFSHLEHHFVKEL